MCPISTLSRAKRRSPHVSSDPQCFIAYVPRGVGLLCALVYTVRGKDVCGWWVGPVSGEYQASFFQLANYFSNNETAFYTTRGSDLYGGWVYDYDRKSRALDKPLAVDDALCHELEHMQFVFAREWLSFAGDEDAEQEASRYHDGELAHQDVNVRFHQLNKLDKHQPVWIYRSAGFDNNVLRRLIRDWPLECWDIEA